jgi:hypothetical protein
MLLRWRDRLSERPAVGISVTSVDLHFDQPRTLLNIIFALLFHQKLENMAQVSNLRQEANKFIPRLEANISHLDETCKALPSYLTDTQAERVGASISEITQIWIRLQALHIGIERGKRAKVDKLLSDGNARLSSPLIENVMETNFLVIFESQKPLSTGVASRVKYFHTAHPDLVVRFCGMILSKEWMSHMNWDIFSRLITRMKAATPLIWTPRILLFLSRLKAKRLRGSVEYGVFYGMLLTLF